MRQDRPNIVHIVTHDQGIDVGCLGHPVVGTPNLDRLAQEGVKFNRHFCCSTPCSPARGCTMTGRYAHSNGLVGLVNFGWSLPERELTIVDYLNDAGYETVHVGFQHERRGRNKNRYRTLLGRQKGKESWFCDLVSDQAADFVRRRRSEDAPFYLNVGYFEVHAPWDRPEYHGRYNPDEIVVPPFLPDNPFVRDQLSKYYGSVTFMDECVGRILRALRETGLDENTLVMFTTDHGISFPRAKSTLYEPGITTVLLIRWPGHIKPGTVCDELINSVDLAPSLLELLGLAVPDRIQGRSFAPFLTGDDYEPNEQIFSERNFHEDFDPMRAVRTKRYKYIRNLSERGRYKFPSEGEKATSFSELWMPMAGEEKRPREQLFDLEKDPNEFNNVAEDPAYAGVLDDLRPRLDRWMADTNDPMRGADETIHWPARETRL